jgi:hypothetical protein
VANRACDAMKADMPEKACRLFAASLERASEQYEMRALYAMALFMDGDEHEARIQADRACGGYPPSVRALCVCAQVYALMGDITTARTLVDRAAREKPEGQDLRLMIYAMGELRMDDRVAEYARLALQETPYDRELLHIRAQNAWNNLTEARQQIDIAKRSIEQAEENLRLNRDYYKAGVSKMSDLLEAQLLYQQALDRHIDALADYQNKLLAYRQSVGE